MAGVINVRVRVHQTGVRRMLGQPFMVDEMYRRGNLVRLHAITIAPVRTGRYVSRFLRRDAVVAGVNEEGAAFVRIDNDAKDPQTGFCYALALEVGTKHMRAQRILRRALQLAAD